MILPFLTIQQKNDKDSSGGWQKSINQYLFWAVSGLVFALFTIAMGNQGRFEKLIDTVSNLCAKVAAIEGKNQEANERQDRRLEVIRQDVSKLGDRVLAIEQHRSPDYRWQGND